MVSDQRRPLNMRKVIVSALAFVFLSLGCTVANAGVIRCSYKVGKKTVKVVKKAAKVTYKVVY
jgi:Na+-driven multidrug efflux pump